MEGKGKYAEMSKIDAKIRLEYSDETLILRGNFFSKCSKNFSIGLMIMFKVSGYNTLNPPPLVQLFEFLKGGI